MNSPEPTWVAKMARLRATLGREPDMNEMLELARSHKMTPSEIAAQQARYARGEAGMGNDHHERAYREAVARGDSAAIERMDAEARVRAAMVGRRN